MKPFMYIGLLFIIVITSGCWDRNEINDLAFIMGTALDLTKNGEISGAVQIAIPATGQGSPNSGGEGWQQKFFVISDVGRNGVEVMDKLQKKLSRKIFASHRSVIFIGESLAKHGIKDVIDIFTHDPRNRLRTYLMVVKGKEGKEILQTNYPFELIPSEAAREMEISGSSFSATLRDFYMSATSEGINPVVGVIEPEDPTEGKDIINQHIFRLAGSAIFKNLKLAGLLDEKETEGLLWVTGKMKTGRFAANMPDGKGNVGLLLTDAKKNITFEIHGDKIKFHVHLFGEGSLYENNTSFNVSKLKNLQLVQKALEKSVEKQVHDFLTKIQKRYKADIIGFGREIYRNQPKQWKALKEQWDSKFSNSDIAVTVTIILRETGMAGPPLQLKEKEIIQ